MFLNTANTPIIGLGETGHQAIEYFYDNFLPDTDLYRYSIEQKSVLKYPALSGPGLTENNYSSKNEKSSQSAVGFILANLAEIINPDNLQACTTNLKANRIFTILLLVYTSSSSENIKADNKFTPDISQLNLAADAVILVPKTGNTTNVNKALQQITDTINAISLNTNTEAANIDFEDVKSVIANCLSVAGIASAHGPDRSREVMRQLFAPPFMLPNPPINGQRILLSILSGPEADLEMEELTLITELIQDKVGEQADVIFGHGTDPSLGSSIKVILLISLINLKVN